MSEWGDDEPAAPAATTNEPVDTASTPSPAEQPAPAADVAPDVDSEAEEPRLVYGSVSEFVREYLRHLHLTGVDGVEVKWAARFWDYRVALLRLDALWRAWEHLRLEPGTGTSVWLRDHFDHHMPILLSKTGPFRFAPEDAENQADDGDPLPYIDPPDGMFRDERESP